MEGPYQADHDQVRLEKAIARAHVDDEFRDRLLADSKGTLAEEGVVFPDEVRITVHEFDLNDRHVFLPPRTETPTEASGQVDVPVRAVARPFLRPAEGGIEGEEVSQDG